MGKRMNQRDNESENKPMIFTNHDSRLAFYSLLLENSLDTIHEIPLPEGYSYVNYKPGDKEQWIAIEKSAEEFENWEDGEKAWAKYFEGKDEELIHRMFFVENNDGEKVATASAFYHKPRRRLRLL